MPDLGTCPTLSWFSSGSVKLPSLTCLKARWDSVSKLLYLGSGQAHSSSACYGTEEQGFGSAGNRTDSAGRGSDNDSKG